MEPTFDIIRDLISFPDQHWGSVLAIGNFDGVHLGHRQIIETLKSIATPDQPKGILSFHPHPRAFFNPEHPPFCLTVLEDKIDLVKPLGADFFAVQQFDNGFSSLSAEDFIEKVLVTQLGIKHVIIGQDFCFGKGRTGTVDMLKEAGTKSGFDVTVIDPVLDEHGHPYSSTRIRQALRDGDPKQAATLMGHPWHVTGEVVCGARQGHRMGFATANIDMQEYVRPLYGVYAVRVKVPATDAWLPGIANIGVRPTVGGHREWLEAHIFDFNETLYGQTIRIQFIDFIRAEMKFKNLDQLKTQIPDDIEKAKAILAA